MGVIAVLVIPSLIKYKNDKEIVTSLKKAYNVLSNSYVLARGSIGDIGDWGLKEDFEGSKNLMNAISPHLKLQKTCDGTTGCFSNMIYKYVDNSNYVSLDRISDKSKGMFLDGMSFIVNSFKDCNKSFGQGALENVCGLIDIDVNGFKKPNQYGRDTFSFYITSAGVIPAGVSVDATNSFDKECTRNSGRGCTAYVLEQEKFYTGEITYGGIPSEECTKKCQGGDLCKDPAACKGCVDSGWNNSNLACNPDSILKKDENPPKGCINCLILNGLGVDTGAYPAQNYNSASNYCKGKGMRLPNANELLKIANYIYSGPETNKGTISPTTAWYWTTTKCPQGGYCVRALYGNGSTTTWSNGTGPAEDGGETTVYRTICVY